MLLAAAYLASDLSWRSESSIHTGMELSAAILAAVIGIIALVRYHSRKSATYLFAAVGFLGAAAFDAFHAVTSSAHFLDPAAARFPSVSAWGWLVGRTFLAAMLLASWWSYRPHDERRTGRAMELTVLGSTFVIVVAVFAVLRFAALPALYREGLLARPYEIVPGLLFLAATTAYWRRGNWRREGFEHWMLLALIVHTATQFLFMVRVTGPFTPLHDLAHVGKIVAYTITLFGLFVSMKTLFDAAEAGRRDLRLLNEQLQGEMAQRAEMETHLAEQKAQIESVLDTMAEGVIFVDPQGQMVRANDGSRSILGMALAQGTLEQWAAGIHVFEADRRTSVPRERWVIQRGLRGEIVHDELNWVITPGHPEGIFVRSSARPVVNEDGRFQGAAVVFRDVTAREQAARAAEERRARLDAVVRTAAEAIVSMDTRGRIIEFNPGAEQVFGHRKEDVLGRPVALLMPPRYRELHDQGLRRYLETGETKIIGRTIELPALRADGDEIEIELSVAVWETSEGPGFTAIMRDISARKAAERMLRESEETYRTLVSEVTDYAIFMLHPDGRIRTWNEGATRLTGYTAQDALGRDFRMLYPADAQQNGLPEQALQEAARGRSEEAGWRLRPDGRRYYAVCVITPVRSTSGELLGFTKVMQDQTEWHQAEERLRESEERYRLLAESATDMIAVHGRDGRFLYVSPAAAALIGYSPEELIGRNVHTFLHPEDGKLFDSLRSRVLAEDETARQNMRFMHRDGHIVWMESIMRWLTDESPHGTERLLATYRDVTARVEDREALARSNRELQEFAFIASHDLKEPLRKIIAFGDRLEAQCADDIGERGADYLQRMRAAAERMRALLEDLLAYSRVTTKAEPFIEVDLKGLVHEVLDDLSEQIQETKGHIDLGALPRVQGDPVQLRQLFQNLLSNALKYHRADEPPQVIVRAHPGPSGTTISVEDNGIGFDMQYVDRIFRPFQRLHGRAEYSGSGMGLAIVRKIVERHGGTIEADSTPGEGTTFTVHLPNQPEQEQEAIMNEAEPHANR